MECKKEINDFIENENFSKENYIDASLLCPDVILDEICDANVITKENLKKYEIDGIPDYNITGSEANFQLTEEEEKIRNEKYQMGNPVQNTRIHCTACNIHLGSALSDYKNIFVHPLLSVIVCKECFEFYTGGTFSKDKDGMEMYCGWCGQGGEVFCCNKCPKVFCKLCIRLNFSSTQYAAVRDSDYWECFVCEPSSMVSLKVQCYEFARYVRNELVRLESLQDAKFYMDIDNSQCCTTSKRQKRKCRTPDPDFLPYSEENCEKSNKKSKIFTKDEWDIGQISNLKNESSAGIEFTSDEIACKFECSSVPECAEKEEKFNFPTLITNPLTSLPKFPETDPLAVTVPTPSIPTSATPIILQRYNLQNPFNFNQNTPPIRPVPIYLPFSRLTPLPGTTLSTPRAVPSQNIVGPKTTFATPSQSRQLAISKAVSNFINSKKVSDGVGSRILFLRCPEGVTKSDNNKTATNTQRKSSTETENTNYMTAQLQSKIKKFEERKAFFNKSSKLDRLLLSTALTNSSCTTTMLGIYQFYDNMKTPEELILVHESLQKSLKTMTDSLIDIRNQLNANKAPAME